MLCKYEILILTISAITKDEQEQLKKYFLKILKDENGNLISFDRWGKYRLAYKVQQNEYGIYFLMRFSVAQENCFKIINKFKESFAINFSTLVMKYLIQKLDSFDSLDYKRPNSLEEVSSEEDIDKIIKETEIDIIKNA